MNSRGLYYFFRMWVYLHNTARCLLLKQECFSRLINLNRDRIFWTHKSYNSKDPTIILRSGAKFTRVEQVVFLTGNNLICNYFLCFKYFITDQTLDSELIFGSSFGIIWRLRLVTTGKTALGFDSNLLSLKTAPMAVSRLQFCPSSERIVTMQWPDCGSGSKLRKWSPQHKVNCGEASKSFYIWSLQWILSNWDRVQANHPRALYNS